MNKGVIKKFKRWFLNFSEIEIIERVDTKVNKNDGEIMFIGFIKIRIIAEKRSVFKLSISLFDAFPNEYNEYIKNALNAETGNKMIKR